MSILRLTTLRLPIIGAAACLLAGCISIGEDPPPALLTLTPHAPIETGTGPAGEATSALTVMRPEVPGSLAVTRVPVQVDASTIAYLQDAVWVDRPAKLFQNLLVTTIRERTGRLVLDDVESRSGTDAMLRGTLRDFGYDAQSGSVIVTYDAIRESAGRLETRRFTARIPGVPAQASPVGNALNDAANQVALDVAEWIGG
ncbi:ABC-type transport auxiliary lipoprotein family protein [Citromicrobium bathyomarinum]|uniref:ABC-type transport auxiliary lipoprotein family protein n=1 Tax=Citromicrobium bathyomarinum TaxID=72174 RepID=UPI00315A1E00